MDDRIIMTVRLNTALVTSERIPVLLPLPPKDIEDVKPMNDVFERFAQKNGLQVVVEQKCRYLYEEEQTDEKLLPSPTYELHYIEAQFPCLSARQAELVRSAFLNKGEECRGDTFEVRTFEQKKNAVEYWQETKK